MTDFAAKARSRRLTALEGLETRRRLRDAVTEMLPQRASAQHIDGSFRSRHGDAKASLFVI